MQVTNLVTLLDIVIQLTNSVTLLDHYDTVNYLSDTTRSL